MNTKRGLYAYLAGSLAAGIALAVWRTILLYRYFDPYNDTFPPEAKGALDTLGYVTAALIFLALTSAILLFKREFTPIPASSHQFSVFASSLLGCLFAAAGILSLVYYAGEIFTQRGTIFYRLMLIASLFSLFLAAIYFILNASSRHDTGKTKIIFCLFPALFAVSYLGASYLSPDFYFSNSNDIFRNVALAAFSFFSVYEMRAVFYGKSNVQRFVFSLAAIIGISVYILPNFIVTAFWEMKLSFSTMFELPLCGVVIYAVSVCRSLILGLLPAKEKVEEEKETQPL